MKKIIFEIFARIGFWIPCNLYMPPKKHWDWVLISFIDCNGNGIRCIPRIAEYSYLHKKWYLINYSDSSYIHTSCVVTHWHILPGSRLTNKDTRKVRGKFKH